MMAVIARIHDTHSNLWSSLQVRPPVGKCELPVQVRFVEGRAAISGYTNDEAGAVSGLKPGDIIESIDGVPVTQLVDSWRPFYAASNESARLRDMSQGMTSGACGPVQVKVRQSSGVSEIAVSRLPRIGPRKSVTPTKCWTPRSMRYSENKKQSSERRNRLGADLPIPQNRISRRRFAFESIRHYRHCVRRDSHRRLIRVVERTLGWLHGFRRLRIRHEREADIHQAFLSLACSLICWRYVERFC